METMDGMNADMARLFRAKDGRRKALSRLPYPEKVHAVIKLQEMAAPILRARGKIVRPWSDSATRANKPSSSTPTNPGRTDSKEWKVSGFGASLTES